MIIIIGVTIVLFIVLEIIFNLNRKTIYYKSHWIGKLLPGRFQLITIGNRVFDKDDQLPIQAIRHEYTHTRQYRKYRVLPYLIVYGAQFCWLYVKLKDFYTAYRAISFEVEARANESNKEIDKIEKIFK